MSSISRVRGTKSRGSGRVIRRIAMLLAAVVVVVPVSAVGAEVVPGQDSIVGGTPATSVAEFPHIALLDLSDGTESSLCGGSLITPTWIMTAAHCVTDESGAPSVDPSGITAVLNTLTSNPLDTGAEVRFADRLIVHPDWDPNTNDNDIALFRITEASAMTPTGLGSASNASLWGAGATATVKGWGTTSSGGDVSNELLEVELPIVSDAACNASAVGPINGELMICAGDLANGGVDSCQGDSGGPLSVPDSQGGWVTVGVVSFGVGCGDPDSPGVYAEVAAFGEWISENVPGLGDGPGPTRARARARARARGGVHRGGAGSCGRYAYRWFWNSRR